MNPFEFLKSDWDNIPQSYRYFILAGLVMLGLAWVSDHWGGQRYTLFGWHFQALFFSLGVSTVMVGFVVVLIKPFFNLSLLYHYRDIYSINNLNKTFVLISFNGRMMLFDLTKEDRGAYHIQTAETATDLNFWGLEISLPINYADAYQNDFELTIGKKKIKINDYPFRGAIKTRG